MRSAVRWAVPGLGVALALGFAANAVSQSQQTCQPVAYQLSNDETGEDVAVVSSDCERTFIARSADDEYSPSLSGNGSQVVFVRRSGEDGSTSLVSRDLQTSRESIFLTSAVLIGGPAVSADGKFVAYWKGDGPDNRPKIWVLEVASGEENVLSKGDQIDSQPAWSPDGGRVAFTRSDPSGSRIVVASPNGAEQSVIAPRDTALKRPTWSPDGRYLAVLRTLETEESTVVIVDSLDGSLVNESSTYPTGVALGWTKSGIELAIPGPGTNVTQVLKLDPESLKEDSRENRTGVPTFLAGGSSGGTPLPRTSTPSRA
jgi:dipeptidyl aminopeptidase/acylaminoacyl peptidase